MKTISDVIEEFIKSSLDDDDFIELSRNDLAKFFSCVPSQINYVLNTRFTVNQGFLVESQRGGGGYIKVVRVQDNDENFLKNVLNICASPIDRTESVQLINQMQDKGIITDETCQILKAVTSPRAIKNPINIDNSLRANILTEAIVEIMKRGGNKDEM